MKKIDLIHTTILIVAILAGYSALEYLFLLLSSLAYLGQVYYATSQFTEKSAYYLIMIVLFSMTCILLVKNARKYAHILLKDEPEASWEDAPKWELDRRNIILVLFLGLGLYTMVQAIPYAISDFYDIFSKAIDSRELKQESTQKEALIIQLLRVTVGAFLIYTAPALTKFIDKTIAVRLDADDSKT